MTLEQKEKMKEIARQTGYKNKGKHKSEEQKRKHSLFMKNYYASRCAIAPVIGAVDEGE